MTQVNSEHANPADPYMPDHRLEIEGTARWVRVMFNGLFVADSKRVLLLRETGRLPVYYFPKEDVRLDLLEPVQRSNASGQKQYWSIRVSDRVAESAAWNYSGQESDRSRLQNHIAFKWNKMDHWYEEEEEVFVHPRDPYTRVDVMPSSRHVRVEVGGTIVADTMRPFLLFETGLPTRYYIPEQDVNMDLLEPTKATTRCPYKGVASYWSIKAGDRELRNVVWSYPEPIPECPKIKGLLCFFNEKVDIYVDDQLQPRPNTPWS